MDDWEFLIAIPCTFQVFVWVGRFVEGELTSVVGWRFKRCDANADAEPGAAMMLSGSIADAFAVVGWR